MDFVTKLSGIFTLIALFGSLTFFIGCSDEPGPVQITEVESGDTTEIFIIDRTGKGWEVSHAQNSYGFKPSEFQFGLGPNAIRPVMNPVMINPGESGYPGNDESFVIMGTRLNNDARAYRIDKMSFHEAATEQFGDIHVTVAY